MTRAAHALVGVAIGLAVAALLGAAVECVVSRVIPGPAPVDAGAP